MAEVYIVNASPIILLGKIERLDVLVWLSARIWVPAVKPVLTALLESGLRLSESLVQVVLAAAEES